MFINHEWISHVTDPLTEITAVWKMKHDNTTFNFTALGLLIQGHEVKEIYDSHTGELIYEA